MQYEALLGWLMFKIIFSDEFIAFLADILELKMYMIIPRILSPFYAHSHSLLLPLP
jgi:hypothetical protein